MTRIRWAFWSLLIGLTALYLLADTLWPAQPGFFPLRRVWVDYTGMLSLAMMSAAMLLAVRPVWLERHLDGLDKMYRLHKWLGIGALVVGTAHWLWAQGTKWAVGWGWLTRPGRGGGAGRQFEPGSLAALLHDWRGGAEQIGELAFYAAALLIVLALVKRFPYRLFARTHLLLAPIYLLLVFHALVLTPLAWWLQPLGWAQALLTLAGTLAALLVLSGRVGARRTAHGHIEALQAYPALQVLETTIRLDQRWAGHRPGQFAFVTSSPREGAHPYTIASAWDAQDRRIGFITKALGDHTAELPENLRIGQQVKVEGPYGCFTFDSPEPRQIWIGAGIGITPFIARMKLRARDPAARRRPVDLFHPTAVEDATALARLRTDAEAAQVHLHVLVDARDGFLSGERLRATVPEWQGASIWFCGPAGFGQALRAELVAQGLPARAFHQELFQMR